MSNIMTLLKDATAPVVGESNKVTNLNRAIQALVSGTGAVTATIDIDVSNDHTNWINLATITLNGTTSDTDGFVMAATWGFTRARLVAITGTNATVTVTLGV